MIGFLFVTAVLLVAALLAFRMIPSYIEYYTVQKALEDALNKNREPTLANVRRAFVCETSLEGTTIALIDDVMTTGATVAAASKALLEAGASRVDAWVVARTPPPTSART